MDAGRWRRVLMAGVRWAVTLAAVVLLGVGVTSYHRGLKRTWVRQSGPSYRAGYIFVVEGSVTWQGLYGGSALGALESGASVLYGATRVAPFGPSGPPSWPPWGTWTRTMAGAGGTFPLWPWVILCGVAAAGLWCGPVGVRRRRRAGVCACGYSREGLQVGAACPECGVVPGAASSRPSR